MTRNKILKLFRKFHKWPGIVITLFVILFSISGIFMNHRGLISAIDINRSWLPADYSYENWNKGAVKSVFQLSPDSALVYGNPGNAPPPAPAAGRAAVGRRAPAPARQAAGGW